MKRDVIIVLGYLFLAIMLATGCTHKHTSAAITFTDLAEREIQLEKIPQKIIVADYIVNFMMVGGAESLDKVVGMTLDGWENTRYGEYTVFTQAFPQLKGGEDGIVSVGGYHDYTLNTELIVSLSPDVIIMSPSQFIENNQNIAVFDRAGISVVVLDYHSQKLDYHTKSTEILGVLLDRKQIAQEQNEAYISAINEVKERIATLPEEQKNKKVYVELGNKGTGEYGNSYSNTMLWGAIVNQIGADNLGAGISKGYGVLDKEFILTSDPDVIFIAGSIWSGDNHNDQMQMGFTVDEETAQQRLAGFANRPEWANMKAVKNGEIYGVDHGSLRNMIDYTLRSLWQSLYIRTYLLILIQKKRCTSTIIHTFLNYNIRVLL